MKCIDKNMLLTLDLTNCLIIDVRDNLEYKTKHLKGSVNIPLNNLVSKLPNLNKNILYYVICENGTKSKSAYHLLKSKGFKVINVCKGLG